METLSLEQKIKKLENLYKDILKSDQCDIEDIHKLRKKTRELLSLISKDDPFYKTMKKVIKFTNEIRDIDVFKTVFLHQIPKKLLHKIDTDSLHTLLEESRKEDIKELQNYLKDFTLPKNIIVVEHEDAHFQNIQTQKLESLEDQKELHKYRIYIKKLVYNYKNFFPKKKKTIKHLEKIKDDLGIINDNFNGLKRLDSFNLLSQKVKEYIDKENQKIFKQIEKLEK